jgi:hypothetical protein
MPTKSRILSARSKGRLLALGGILAVVLSIPVLSAGDAVSAAARIAEEPHDGHYCDGCQPPMEYSGGPTMDTSSAVVVTPIFWAPDDADPFPDGYVDGIDRYITDVAAASGQQDNVYSVVTEYDAEADDGTSTPLSYSVEAGAPIIDTSPFPDGDCTPDSDDTPVCITDAQLTDELAKLIQEQGLPTGLGYFYPVFFPPGVQTQDRDKTTSGSSYCGYHRIIGDAPDQIVYGDEPYEDSGCDGGQIPNGSAALDGAINTLSHELAEALTDPDADASAWLDHTGHEIGDICADDYGTALGSVDPENPFTTEYNQVINGHKYYTQTEFSNSSYEQYGQGYGCAQSEQQATTDPATSPKDVAEVFSDVTPSTTDRKGDETELRATVYDRAGDPVSGDAVTFTAYVVSGDGNCGKFSDESATTDDQGAVTTTYTSTSDAVTCALVAHEARGGHSGTSRVYQGKAADTAPQATATFPGSLEPGGAAQTFTTTFTNPSDEDISSAQVEFDVYPADKATVAVDDTDLHLTYSTKGPDGPFRTLKLHGSTADGGAIYGIISPDDGLTLKANSGLTVYYRLSADEALPMSTTPQLSLEAYLDQENLASGAGTTIADTYATDVRFAPPTPWYQSPWLYVGGGLFLLLAIAVVIVLLVRRSRRGGPTEPAENAS